MKPYNKSNIPLAKQLRKNMTPWERKLWYDYLRYYPLRFQRQKAIGNYIADFYCAKAHLVIELDGGGHYMPEQAHADTIRTQNLENMNLQVLRICNLDIDKNFSGVCEYIDSIVQAALPQSASLTAPSSEGAVSGQKNIYALGFFDGVHLGHQALLAACVRLAEQTESRPCALTFDVHPQDLVQNKAPLLINTPGDRRLLLEHFGIADIHTLQFDQRTRQMPWQDFFRYLTNDLQAVGLVCGEDFRFGYKGEGNARLLQQACAEQGIPCIVVPEQTKEGVRISSTYIRQLMADGDPDRAVAFLGHPHILSGTVISGRKLGRTIGIPTANIQIPEGVILPPKGVYACLVRVGQSTYPAVTNIGSRPTVGGHAVTVEPWLLDFDQDLYGKQICVEFHKFLRPEQKFESLEALQLEILKNAEQTRIFFEKK